MGITMKNARGVSTVVIVVAVVGLILSTAMYFIFNNVQSRVSLLVGDGAYKARVVESPDSRDNGLKGIVDFKKDDALLMVFPSDDLWKIDISNNNFPVDIIWLNQNKKIIYSVSNISTESGDKVYVPIAKARYVIELAGGSINDMQIRSTSTVIFSVNEDNVK